MVDETIIVGTRYVFEIKKINRDLLEKALHMRCVAYLATVKSELLIQTIFKIDSSKKKLRRDFDELMRLQEALRRQALIFENISDGVIIAGIEGDIIDCNPAAEKIFGYLKKELVGERPEILHKPEDKKSLEKIKSRETDIDKERRLEISFLRKDGTEGIAELKIMPLTFHFEDKQQILSVWLYVDVTEVLTLRGFLPICASCKKIRDDKGYWNQIESYIRDHSEVEFTHGLCPVCVKDFMADIKPKE